MTPPCPARPRLVAAGIAALLACSNAEEPQAGPSTEPVAVAGAEAPEPEPVVAASPHGLAESPLTPLADAMVDVALAALREEAPRAGAVPLIPSDEPGPCSAEGGVDRDMGGPMADEASRALCADPEGVEVAAVQIDLGVQLKPYSDDAPREARANAVQAHFIVHAGGWGVAAVGAQAELHPRFEELPAWLEGMVPAAIDSLLGDLRSDEPERCLAPLETVPPVYREALGDHRARPDWEAVQTLAALEPERRRYSRDDLYVHLRHGSDWFTARVFLASEDRGLSTRVLLRAVPEP